MHKGLKNRLKAVSYTHLDVYKRQVYKNVFKNNNQTKETDIFLINCTFLMFQNNDYILTISTTGSWNTCNERGVS